MKKVLLVDDDKNIRASWRRTLKDSSFESVIVSSAEHALHCLQTEEFSLIVTDYQMPHIDGVQFCRTIQNQYPHIKRIMLSGQLSLTVATAALNEGGISLLLHKPISVKQLKLEILNFLHHTSEQCGESITVNDETVKELEKEYPGITEVKRDRFGYIIL